mmetsp:Transcript_529/g.651  ORF Transcript_529/g.651 Transcript_529/m.651 type:complete len:270 (+) Transcript_529:42-851(+)
MSQVYQIMEMMLVGKPMTSSMLKDIHNPVNMSYAWPKSTTATFVELLARMSEVSVSAQFKALSKDVLTKFFISKDLSQHPHIRNRTFALRCECALRYTRLGDMLDKKIARKVLFDFVPPQYYYAQVQPLKDLRKQKSGIFEPSLAAVLVNNLETLTSMKKVSGKWILNEEYSQDSEVYDSALFTWIGKRNSVRLQVIDNVCFDLKTNVVGLMLPMKSLITYKYIVLVDVQTYEIVTEPNLVSDLRNKRKDTILLCLRSYLHRCSVSAKI